MKLSNAFFMNLPMRGMIAGLMTSICWMEELIEAEG